MFTQDYTKQSKDSNSNKVIPDKLPSTIQPSHYDLTLYPDLSTLKFQGTVKINLTVKEATDRIKIHAKELYVRKVTIDSGASLKSKQEELKDDLLTLVFNDVIPAGERMLTLEFSGEHNDQMAGFYRSRYKNAKGEEKIMVSTQFEALDARRCFPCWDEPAAKATFKCTLVVKTGLHALSNMPVEQRSVEKNGTLTRFEYMTTPIMSTYLLAFCVGEFDYVAGTTKNGVSIRVFAPPGRSEQGRFALDVAIRT